MKKREEWLDPTKKLYVVNTCGNKGTLHINDGRCRHAKRRYDFADFENEQSAFRAFDNNLKKCGICFREELKGE